MQPIECSINWNYRFERLSELQIVVNEIPNLDDLRYKHIDLGCNELWFAEKEGYVSFFSWASPKQSGGFNGRHFPIILEDGSMITLLGPWASRAGVMNKHFLPQCLDVAIKVHPAIKSTCWRKAAVTLEFALEAIKLCKEPIELVVNYDHGEYIFVPQHIRFTATRE